MQSITGIVAGTATRAVAAELQWHPEGRKVRPGLEQAGVRAILERIRQALDAPGVPTKRKQLYVNAVSAIAVCYEKLFRVGEVCRGKEFDHKFHWSRATIKGVREVQRRARAASEELGSIVVQPPLRKTSRSKSDAAREKANLQRDASLSQRLPTSTNTLDVATHRVQRRPNHSPPPLDLLPSPGAQMLRPGGGAPRCTTPPAVHSGRL